MLAALPPRYDVRFRGYGMNKIVLIASLNFYNFTFWVHPGAWIVHNPHADTDVRKKASCGARGKGGGRGGGYRA